MTPNNAQNTQHKLGVVFSYLERNNITATLCNKGGFFLDCICVDTQLPYFDALTHMVIHVSAAFFFNICRRKAYISICACQRLLDLPKRSIPWVKFYFGLSRHIFSMVRHCLWKMCATPAACINETGLFSSVAVVPQSKSTELCSWAVVVPHNSNRV